MKIIIFLFVYFSLFSLVSAEEVESEERVVLDEIVLSIDDEPVLSSEVLKDQTPSSTDEVKASIQTFVADKLIAKEAKKHGISVDDTDIDAYVDEVIKQNQMTESEFLDFLKTKDLDLDLYKEQAKAEILKSRVLAREVRTKVQVTDSDIIEYLEARPDMAPKENSVLVYLVEKPCTEVEKCESILEELRKKVISEEHSLTDSETIYGARVREMGYLVIDELREELASKLKDLDEKQASAVETDQKTTNKRFYYLADKLEEGEVVQGKLRNAIHSEIFEERFQAKFKKYISQELPARYFVDVK